MSENQTTYLLNYSECKQNRWYNQIFKGLVSVASSNFKYPGKFVQLSYYDDNGINNSYFTSFLKFNISDLALKNQTCKPTKIEIVTTRASGHGASNNQKIAYFGCASREQVEQADGNGGVVASNQIIIEGIDRGQQIYTLTDDNEEAQVYVNTLINGGYLTLGPNSKPISRTNPADIENYLAIKGEKNEDVQLIITWENRQTAPTAPTNVLADDFVFPNSSKGLTVSWFGAKNGYDNPINGYKITYIIQDETTEIVKKVGSEATSCNFALDGVDGYGLVNDSNRGKTITVSVTALGSVEGLDSQPYTINYTKINQKPQTPNKNDFSIDSQADWAVTGPTINRLPNVVDSDGQSLTLHYKDKNNNFIPCEKIGLLNNIFNKNLSNSSIIHTIEFYYYDGYEYSETSLLVEITQLPSLKNELVITTEDNLQYTLSLENSTTEYTAIVYYLLIDNKEISINNTYNISDYKELTNDKKTFNFGVRLYKAIGSMNYNTSGLIISEQYTWEAIDLIEDSEFPQYIGYLLKLSELTNEQLGYLYIKDNDFTIDVPKDIEGNYKIGEIISEGVTKSFTIQLKRGNYSTTQTFTATRYFAIPFSNLELSLIEYRPHINLTTIYFNMTDFINNDLPQKYGISDISNIKVQIKYPLQLSSNQYVGIVKQENGQIKATIDSNYFDSFKNDNNNFYNGVKLFTFCFVVERLDNTTIYSPAIQQTVIFDEPIEIKEVILNKAKAPSDSLYSEGTELTFVIQYATYNSYNILPKIYIAREDKKIENEQELIWSEYIVKNSISTQSTTTLGEQYINTVELFYEVPEITVSKYIYFKAECASEGSSVEPTQYILSKENSILMGKSVRHVAPTIDLISAEYNNELNNEHISFIYELKDSGFNIIDEFNEDENFKIVYYGNEPDASSISISDINEDNGTGTYSYKFSENVERIEWRLWGRTSYNNIEKISSSDFLFVYNFIPTIQYRKNCLGFNLKNIDDFVQKEENSDRYLAVIGDTNNRRIVMFNSTDGKKLKLYNFEVDGYVTSDNLSTILTNSSGGTWDE